MMRRVCTVLRRGICLACLLGFAPSLAAQTCPAPPHPYFAFQVEARAVFVPDSMISPRPAARRAASLQAEAAVVQFVVDSLGVPDAASYKVLAARDLALANAGRAALTRWRFRPARLGGCAVPQLVQAPLDP